MKYYILLFILGLFMITGCKEVDKLTQFDMDYKSSVTLPANSSLNLPINLYTPSIETNSESTFSVNNTNKDLVEKVILKQLTLTLKSPDTGDLSFLESIEIYIKADGLDEVKVAEKNNIPDNVGKSLSLETSGIDLKEYIKKDKIQLRVKTVTDKLISEDHQIEILSTFFVDAKILGV